MGGGGRVFRRVRSGGVYFFCVVGRRVRIRFSCKFLIFTEYMNFFSFRDFKLGDSVFEVILNLALFFEGFYVRKLWFI